MLKKLGLTKLIVWGSLSLSAVVAGTVTLSVTGAAKITNPKLTYECRFYNYDNTFLYSCGVSPSRDATYNGPTPEREDTLYTKYLFKGWDGNLENITENKTFHALYQEKKKDYQVTFVNYDGSLLYETYVEAGDIPHYGGETPTKMINDSFEYTFNGWDKILEKTYENTVYTATFVKAEIFVNAKFVNYDGALLYEAKVPYNGTALYNAPNPKRESNTVVKYTFSGWDKSLYGLIEDTIFTAQYKEEIPTYTVTFVNYDGEFLSSCVVNYMASATYTGPTPRKPSEGNYVYVFSGWDQAFNAVTEDMVVTAQFETTVPQFTVTFKNDDGTILGSDTGEIGFTAEYDGEDPTKEDDEQFSYSFIGWDRPLENVRSTFFTIALYEKTPRKHTVKFLNYDGTELDEQLVEHGEGAYYDGPYPITRPSDLHFEYTFIGWSEDVNCVEEDMVVYAEYDADPIEHSSPTNSGSSGSGSVPGDSGGTSYSPPIVIDDDEEEEEEAEKEFYYVRFYNHNLSLVKEDLNEAYKTPFFDMETYGDELVRNDLTSNGYSVTFQSWAQVPWIEENVIYANSRYGYIEEIAEYSATKNNKQYYTICFRNDDKSLIKEYILQKNSEIPDFPNNFIPQPKSRLHRGMVFVGWDKQVDDIATKSVTYFAMYAKRDTVTGPYITTAYKSQFIPQMLPILNYSTSYTGDLYFREISYSDFLLRKDDEKVVPENEWDKFVGYGLSGITYENLISPLDFTSDKLRQLHATEYTVTGNIYSSYRKYFGMHPSYVNVKSNKSRSDAYLVQPSNSSSFSYTFMPNNLTKSTVTDLKAVNYSSSKYDQQESLYRQFVRQQYLAINDPDLDTFIKSFIEGNKSKLHISTSDPIGDIFRVKDFLHGYGTYDTDTHYASKVSAVKSFLTTGHGDSSHFASALTAIYRALKVPARYVTGARTTASAGTYGTNTLYTNELWAWTEVYIDGVGWITMDASVDASGDIGPAHNNVYNPFGEVDPAQRMMTVTVSPETSSKYYDGTRMGVSYSITGSLEPGDHIEVNLLRGHSSVGQHVTRAMPRVYDEDGNDVTLYYIGRIEMVYEEYTIEKATLKITTQSASKTYDGSALYGPGFTYTAIHGDLASTDTISLTCTGSQTKRGSSMNYVDLSTFKITNEDGADVLDNYNIIWEYGRLTVN